MKINTDSRKRKRIIASGPPRMSRGDTPVDELKIGDTFHCDGIESKIDSIRHTPKMIIFTVFNRRGGKYERRFLNDSSVKIVDHP